MRLRRPLASAEGTAEEVVDCTEVEAASTGVREVGSMVAVEDFAAAASVAASAADGFTDARRWDQAHSDIWADLPFPTDAATGMAAGATALAEPWQLLGGNRLGVRLGPLTARVGNLAQQSAEALAAQR